MSVSQYDQPIEAAKGYRSQIPFKLAAFSYYSVIFLLESEYPLHHLSFHKHW